MSERHVIRDIAAKCSDDVAEAISRNMKLVDGGEAMTQVAVMAAGRAIGVASGAFLAFASCHGEEVTGDEVVDALFERMRPIVMRAIKDLMELSQ